MEGTQEVTHTQGPVDEIELYTEKAAELSKQTESLKKTLKARQTRCHDHKCSHTGRHGDSCGLHVESIHRVDDLMKVISKELRHTDSLKTDKASRKKHNFFFGHDIEFLDTFLAACGMESPDELTDTICGGPGPLVPEKPPEPPRAKQPQGAFGRSPGAREQPLPSLGAESRRRPLAERNVHSGHPSENYSVGGSRGSRDPRSPQSYYDELDVDDSRDSYGRYPGLPFPRLANPQSFEDPIYKSWLGEPSDEEVDPSSPRRQPFFFGTTASLHLPFPDILDSTSLFSRSAEGSRAYSSPSPSPRTAPPELPRSKDQRDVEVRTEEFPEWHEGWLPFQDLPAKSEDTASRDYNVGDHQYGSGMYDTHQYSINGPAFNQRSARV